QRHADAAPVLAHLAEGTEVDLQKHRNNHQPDEPGYRQIDPGDFRARNGGEQPGQKMPECDARDDTERDPKRQITFEEVHRGYAASGRNVPAPSPWPISRSRVLSDILSMLPKGRLVKMEMRFLR